MHNKQEPDLDALIEAALGSGEALLPAPVTLRRGVEKRLRFARLRDREERRFRYALLLLCCGAAGAFAATIFLVSQTLASPVFHNGIAGGRGFLDYYTTAIGLAWGEQQENYLLPATLFLALSTLALGLLPLRKILANN